MAAISSGHIKWLWFSFALLIFGPIAYTIIVTFRSLVQRSHPAVSVLYKKVRGAPLSLILRFIVLITFTVIVVIVTISITAGSRLTATLHISMSTPRPDANSISVKMVACLLRTDVSPFLILPHLSSPSR